LGYLGTNQDRKEPTIGDYHAWFSKKNQNFACMQHGNEEVGHVNVVTKSILWKHVDVQTLKLSKSLKSLDIT